MQLRILPLVAALLLGLSAAARAELQLGAGGLFLDGDGDDDLMPGLSFELGGFYPGGVLDSFFGAQLFFGGDTINEDEWYRSDEGYLGVLALYRGYLPLGFFKLYGEGGLGVGRSSVEYSLRGVDIDTDEFGFSYQLGLGVEFSFTDHFGIRGGYDFIGLPEADTDFGTGGGGFHSLTLGVTIRF